MKHYYSSTVFFILFGFIWFLSMPCMYCDTTTSSRQSYFASMDTGDFRFENSVVEKFLTLSGLDCTVSCSVFDTCVAVNVNQDLRQCELLTEVPLSPHTDLVQSPGWRYYEKTCQLPLRVSGCARKSATEQWLVADGGASVYTATFSSSLDLLSVTLNGATVDVTVENFPALSGLTVVLFNDKLKIKLAISDQKLYCTLNIVANQTTVPCQGSWPKSTLSVFGQKINAIISTRPQKGIWAFGDSIIMKAIPLENGDLDVTEKYDVSNGDLPDRWKNIPRNLVGASWIDSGFTKAFLLTNTYYVIYDVTSNTIEKRGFLCL